MDYNSLRSPRLSNSPSSSSPHRLPTISAVQALNDLNVSSTRCISTGLKDLDILLRNRDPVTVFDGDAFFGGVSRGKVTEIWGPPGVGKTCFGMQLASSALNEGDRVIWVDGSHPIPGPRFSKILTSFQPTMLQKGALGSSPLPSRSLSDLLENLTHFSTPTLAHLIALLTHPTTAFPPPKTSLIVVDSFSTLVSNAFPRNIDSTATPRKPGASKLPSRKFPILQYLINSFQKLAATRNIAIVILSQCVTKIRSGTGAVLLPAINVAPWEQSLGCRIALFMDWGWDDGDGNEVHVRLAEVVKTEGITLAAGRRKLVGFTIGETGLLSLALPTLSTQIQDPTLQLPILNQNAIESPSVPLLPQKRKVSAADLEIPDSEGEDDEDYGWAEEDEDDIPPMPPQWQGSEDILVPPVGELEGENEGIEEDSEEQLEDRADEGGDLVEDGISVEEDLVVEDSEDELAL